VKEAMKGVVTIFFDGPVKKSSDVSLDKRGDKWSQ
jgi:hypothetical protein